MTLSENIDNDTLTPASYNPQLSALPCDAWHHYYHYQASAQYLWLAETLRALGCPKEALATYDKAIFQDHLNGGAIEGKEGVMRGSWRVVRVPVYDKHLALDTEFCKSVGKDAGEATLLHDAGINALLAGENAKALSCFDKAITADREHSNSYFARGKCRFAGQEYKKARDDFEEAILLSHLYHEAYHRFASGQHLARGLKFLGDNAFDLTIADCTKALDLYRGNKDALKTRALAYRAKGNLELAEADEKYC